MKILFHLGHPAHFHLFKNTFKSLKENGVEPLILIKKKDILEDLLKRSGFEYLNILPDGRKNGKVGAIWGLAKQDIELLKIARKHKPTLLVGSSLAITHVGKLLGIPSVHFGEDDAELVPQYAKVAFPFATHLVAPNVCSVGKWSDKKVPYSSYQKLAYLHPGNFTPSKEIAGKYVDMDDNYFIIRTVKLNAYHDDNKKGLTPNIVRKLIEMLEGQGKVYITSEIPLENDLEQYRININPIDIHHVMAFANMFIGDSQSMAVESGVLGVPFIRFNDFIGKISVLNEIENHYQLGYGIKSDDPEKLFQTITEIIQMENSREEFQKRRQRMLNEKVDLAKLISAMLLDYPNTIQSIKNDPEFQFTIS